MKTMILQSPDTGILHINSEPPGATIYIDDIERIGLATPTIITDIPVGTHTYRLSMSGYDDNIGTFDIIIDKITIIDATLIPLTPGYLYISSIPTGAKIYIDDIERIDIVTPAEIRELPVGPHTYRLSISGYEDNTGTFDIITGQITIIEVTLGSLVQNTGYLYVSSTPLGAEIFIDSIDQELVTPMIIPNLFPGTHTYVLSLPDDDYIDKIGSFDITSGNITVVSETFTTIEDGCANLNSVPRAEIFINNIDQGLTTPAHICGVPLGRLQFRLSGTFEASQNGCAEFMSVPKYAHIFIDNIDIGKDTPKKICGLSPGIHTFSMIGTVKTKKEK